MYVIVTEKKSVADEYCKVLRIQSSEKTKGYVKGNSPVLNTEVAVTWCRGHLVTMLYPEEYDERYKKWNIDDLPFLPSSYKYKVIADCKEQFSVIKSLYNSPDTERIYFAGDSGREGLYIQLLVRQMTGVKSGVSERVVWIDSYTEKEILNGIKEAKDISAYKLRGDAAYMRAIEDYAVGINLSRALSCKFAYKLNKDLNTKTWKTISVGRVMTAVLAMVVDREREIRNFKETPFYKLEACFAEDEAEWKAVEGSKYHESPLLYNENGFREKASAESFLTELSTDKKLFVENVKKTTEKKGAPLLFNLAEIQFFCSKKYKLSPNETLEVIQSLYEKKLVTYPRTDARVLSTAVAENIAENISGLKRIGYKEQIVDTVLAEGRYKAIAKSPYVDDSKITDHYAIIPTGVKSGYESLPEKERNIYHDIVDRFLSIFYPAAVYEKTEVVLKHSNGEKFFYSKKVLKEAGYLKVLEEDKYENVPAFEKDTYISVDKFIVKEGKTTAPKRYSSGSMIIAMENAGKMIEDEELRAQIKGAGIGTSATRGAIIDKLISKEYMALNKKTQILTPTYLGECIYDIVKSVTPRLLSAEMTANWEKGLEQIETGQTSYEQYGEILNKYVVSEVEKIKAAGKVEYSGDSSKEQDILQCPLCKKGTVKQNKKAYYCSEYHSGCNFTIWKEIAGKMLTPAQVKALVTKGKTSKIKGFKKSSGEEFEASLVLENGKIKFSKGK